MTFHLEDYRDNVPFITDGQLLIYQSNRSGSYETYARRFSL